MYTTKHGSLHLAFLLGFCNMLIGSSSRYSFIKFLESVPNKWSYLLNNISYMLGFLFSEFYFLKLGGKHAISLLWVYFAISYALLMSLMIAENQFTLFLSGLGFCISFFSQALLLIVEIGYIASYIKSNPNSYALTYLMVLNELPWVLASFLLSASVFINIGIFCFSIIACFILTKGFKSNPNPNGFVFNRKSVTILPFSAFLAEFYAFGAYLGIYRIGGEIIRYDDMYFIEPIAYIVGAFLVTTLLNLNRGYLILGIIVSVPIFCTLFIALFQDTNAFVVATAFCINMSYGIMEILNLYLIVVNSNRPEFFIGMLYFVGELVEVLIYLTYEIFLPDLYPFLALFFVCALVAAKVLKKSDSGLFRGVKDMKY